MYSDKCEFWKYIFFYNIYDIISYNIFDNFYICIKTRSMLVIAKVNITMGWWCFQCKKYINENKISSTIRSVRI